MDALDSWVWGHGPHWTGRLGNWRDDKRRAKLGEAEAEKGSLSIDFDGYEVGPEITIKNVLYTSGPLLWIQQEVTRTYSARFSRSGADMATRLELVRFFSREGAEPPTTEQLNELLGLGGVA